MLHNSTLLSQAKRLAFLLVPALFLTGAVFAQPGTAFVSITNVSGTPVNFSDASSWAGAAVPGDTSNVTISNCYMLMDVDMVFGSLTIAPGGYLDFGSRTLTVMDQLLCSQLNGVYNSGGTSTVILKSTVADGGSGTVTVGGGNNVTLYNVQVFDGSVVDFDAGGDGTTETTITNELTMGGGSVVVNPPIYGGASTLLYDATYAAVGTEWTAGASSGKGVPHHVSIGSGGSLSFGSTSSNYTCTGDFSINDASGSLTLSSMLGDLTVDGNFTSGANSAVTINMPTEEGKGNLIVGGNMTLNGNTTWSGDEGNLTVRGNLTNNVTGGAAFGLLKLSGSSDQDVTGNLITVDSLVVAHTANNGVQNDTDVDFQANVDITPGGVFNPVTGTAKITGTFTMNSDATGTARIATLRDDATSDVDGNITFERYVKSTASNTWMSVGNYVIGANRSHWNTSFGAAFNLVFDWDETHVENQGTGSNGVNAWTVITGSDALHYDGEGYYVFGSAGTDVTLSAPGTYNTGNVGYGVSFTNTFMAGGGWHVLANPFPSPIDATQFLSDNSTLISDYYMLDNSDGVFKTKDTGAPGTIDVGQSFWVQVSSSGTINFNTTQITYGSNSFVREIDPLEDAFVGIKVQNLDGSYGSTFVRFHENGTEDFEWEWELIRKGAANNTNPEIYTVLDNGLKLLINSPGALADVTEVPFVVETGAVEGTVSIGMSEYSSALPSGTCAYIEDTETGERVGFGNGEMVVELEPNQTYADRFVLVMDSSPEFSVTSSYCEGGIVHFEGEDSGLWEIDWSDESGAMNGTGCVTGLEPGQYSFNALNPANQCFSSAALAVELICMGDFNVNGERDITDLLILLVGIQPVDNYEGNFPDTDCDCDGVMTTLDLLMFLPEFGAFCD